MLFVSGCAEKGVDKYAMEGYGWELVSQKWSNGKKEPVTLNMQGLFIQGDGTFDYRDYGIHWIVNYIYYDWQFENNDPPHYVATAPKDLYGPKSGSYVCSLSFITIRQVKPSDGREPYDEILFDLPYSAYVGNYRFINNGDEFTITNEEGTKYLKFERRKHLSYPTNANWRAAFRTK